MDSPTSSPVDEQQPTLAETPSDHERCDDHADDSHRSDNHTCAETCDCTAVTTEKEATLKGRMSKKRRGDWPDLRTWNPALTLENSGSVARDHLASERTFLAYVRTSLTIASTGVALVQLFTISAETTNKALEPWSRPIGATIIALGLATLCFGVIRYFAIQNALLGGNYPVARASSILLAILLGTVIVIVFGVLLGVHSKTAS